MAASTPAYGLGGGGGLSSTLSRESGRIRAAAAHDTLKGAMAKSLYSAAGWGGLKELHRFIRKGVDVNTRFEAGNTALQNAAFAGQIAAMAVLLDAGANPNLQSDCGLTPLMAAARIAATKPSVSWLSAERLSSSRTTRGKQRCWWPRPTVGPLQ